MRKEVVSTIFMWDTAFLMSGLTWWSFRRYNYQSRLAMGRHRLTRSSLEFDDLVKQLLLGRVALAATRQSNMARQLLSVALVSGPTLKIA